MRIPCCLTGLAGIKAHFGRVPVWPVSATPTLAHVGPIARNVTDAALVLTAISGYDPRDPFSVSAAIPDLLGACRQCSGSAYRLQSKSWLRPPGRRDREDRDRYRARLEELGCSVSRLIRCLTKIQPIFGLPSSMLALAQGYVPLSRRNAIF